MDLEYKKYIAELMDLDIKEVDEAVRLLSSIKGFDNKEEFEKFDKAKKDGTLKGFLEIGKKLFEASGLSGIESIREIVKSVNGMVV